MSRSIWRRTPRAASRRSSTAPVRLPAAQARGGELLARGRIFVAPPGRNLLVRGPRAVVVRGPHENGPRPAIDPLFRSAAVTYGRRAVAVVLSGTRDDGVSGASAVGTREGCVFVHDPEDSLFPILPAHTVSRDLPTASCPSPSWRRPSPR